MKRYWRCGRYVVWYTAADLADWPEVSGRQASCEGSSLFHMPGDSDTNL